MIYSCIKDAYNDLFNELYWNIFVIGLRYEVCFMLECQTFLTSDTRWVIKRRSHFFFDVLVKANQR